MIHQLILNSLLACQPKADVKSPLTETQKIDPKIEEITPPIKEPILDAEFIILSETLPEPKTSKPMEGFYANPVHLSHLIYPKGSSDEAFCNNVCAFTYQTSAGSSRYSEFGNIQNCKLELISDWEEKQKSVSTSNISEETNLIVGAVECNAQIYQYMKGRAGISASHGSETGTDLGGYFARAAQEEMIAVFAFQEMLANLRDFNAPKHLLDDCERAICDEQRHTMMMSAFAKRHGATSAVVELPTQKNVSLFDLAKHNAIAGCIEETWSALVVEYQSKHTTQYTKLFEIIAKDEIFHAQLSWDIHQWLMSQLSVEEQSEIQRLMSKALETSPPSENTNIEIGEMNTQLQEIIWNEFSSRLSKQIA